MPAFFLSSKLRNSDSWRTSSPTLLQIATLSSKLSLQLNRHEETICADDLVSYSVQEINRSQWVLLQTMAIVCVAAKMGHCCMLLVCPNSMRPNIVTGHSLTLFQMTLLEWVCLCSASVIADLKLPARMLFVDLYWAHRPCCCSVENACQPSIYLAIRILGCQPSRNAMQLYWELQSIACMAASIQCDNLKNWQSLRPIVWLAKLALKSFKKERSWYWKPLLIAERPRRHCRTNIGSSHHALRRGHAWSRKLFALIFDPPAMRVSWLAMFWQAERRKSLNVIHAPGVPGPGPLAALIVQWDKAGRSYVLNFWGHYLHLWQASSRSTLPRRSQTA